MTRPYSLRTLTRLPVLDSPSAVGLATALETAASGQKGKLGINGRELEEMLLWYLGRIKNLAGSLSTLLQPAAVTGDTPETVATKSKLGGSWGSFRSWVSSWETIGEGLNPAPEETAAMAAFLFGEGLTFMQASSVQAWQASQARIDGVMANPSWLAALHTLGGSRFFEGVRTAQAAYGDALGLTAVPAAEQEAAVQSTRLELQDAMRGYIATAVVFANPLRPESADVSAALLQPANSWVSSSVSSSATAGETGASSEAGGASSGQAAEMPA